jgi:hypothetical protein
MVSILITGVIPRVDSDALNPSTPLGAFYMSWAAGVALFTLVGLIVAVTSVVRPDQEHFDVRARNLLRRQSGPHIDYVMGRLKEIVEPYIEHTEKRYVVQRYNETEKKFYVNHITTSTLRSFFDDINASFSSSLTYENGSSPPSGEEPCSLTYLKVNGSEIGKPEDFEGRFHRSFVANVPRKSVCKIEHRLNYWVKAEEEPNRHRPLRYTRSLSIVVENNGRRAITARMMLADGRTEHHIVKPGGSMEFFKALEIVPTDTEIYDFRLSPA